MSRVKIEMGPLRNKVEARTGRIETVPGDKVLAACRDGLDTATVIGAIEEEKQGKSEWKLVRKLKKEDYRILQENKTAAVKKRPAAVKEINDEGLDMKLTCLHYTYDRSKLYVYYTAEGRVDFRNLIRNLGSKFKVRIQMVQIGVRDEAAILGGIGLCGREVCCRRFLRNIEAVNIDMARNQNLVQNTENISGCCGRLLCCLRFEDKYYRRLTGRLPCIGKKVLTPSGKGTVESLDPIKNSIEVKLKDGTVEEFDKKSISSGVKERLKKWIK